MLIALVYDLRSEYLALGYAAEAVAEFDADETIAALAAALARLGHRVERIGNGRALARARGAGQRFDLVFSIAEGLRGRSREAQVAALCELYEQAYVFSDPMTLAVALDKGAAKCLVRDAGVPTAPFCVIEPGQSLPEALGFDYPVFVKPLAEGTGKGCAIESVCHDIAALAVTVADLRARFQQAVIVEPFLSGREFTVGLVGSGAQAQVVGVIEIMLNAGADAGVYSYRNKEECASLVTYRAADDEVARQAGTVALAAYAALGCRDGGRLDLRCDSHGVPWFLEANPLAGLHPAHSDLPITARLHGRSYDWLIGAIVASAAARHGLATTPTPRAVRARELVPVIHAAMPERADELDTVTAAEAVATALEQAGYASTVLRFAPCANVLDHLASLRPHAVFNLVEAIDGEALGALLAPWFLQHWQLAYTGNSFTALLTTASKLLIKGLLTTAGVSTPLLAHALAVPTTPVIVKPVWEHASLGIDAESVVSAAAAARVAAERSARSGTRYFAEAFIDGREFNVALLERAHGVELLPIPEIVFTDWPSARPRVVDYAAKWQADSAAYRNTPRRFGIETAEPELAAALGDCALAVWRQCALRGYARVDMRVDAAGTIYVIDVNANPGIGPDAGFVATAAQAGIDFIPLVTALVASAARPTRRAR